MSNPVTRADVLRGTAAAAATAFVAIEAIRNSVTARAAEAPTAPDARSYRKEIRWPKNKVGLLERMHADLERALKKPVEERHWSMAIDRRKCVGCDACTVSCIAENKLPPEVVYRPVIKEEIGTYPNVSYRFTPRPCMQCDNPPCTPVCPVNATWKRPDGVVAINYDRCIGCRYCITACPYNARTFDFGENYTGDQNTRQPYEEAPSFEYGQRRVREDDASPVGNARKCTFCLHRVHVGMLPSCVTTCIGGATYFGDVSDPKSLIAELAGRPNVTRLKEELGTKPSVFYLD
ncbi:MAG: 4Fe-4S dicluster domain-containing protein [Candidatus Dadabacteria bacterium]|nr:MAG: 4Fe-4S dicluster domain-containing protein [Candidatus Dadabacteria bacterium]